MRLVAAIFKSSFENGIEAITLKDKVYIHVSVASSTFGHFRWFFESESDSVGLDLKLAQSEEFEPFDPKSEWQQEYIKKNFPGCLDRFVPRKKEEHPLKDK
ncbi:MAG: hypothetical protein QXL01_01550 [Thermoplasmatales archaeon]